MGTNSKFGMNITELFSPWSEITVPRAFTRNGIATLPPTSKLYSVVIRRTMATNKLTIGSNIRLSVVPWHIHLHDLLRVNVEYKTDRVSANTFEYLSIAEIHLTGTELGGYLLPKTSKTPFSTDEMIGFLFFLDDLLPYSQ